MASFSEDLMADTSVSLRPWIIPALSLSIAFHGALFYAFSQKTLARFESPDQPRLVPRVFSVNRLQVDQKLLQPEAKKPEKPASLSSGQPASAQTLAQFDGSFEKDIDKIREVRATPEVNSPAVPDIKDKPSVEAQSALNAAAEAKAENALAIDKELNEVRQQLLDDKPDVATRPKISSGKGNNPGRTLDADAADSMAAGTGGIPAGFSNLDTLLTSSGKVGGGTAPILMPTDLLFDYNSATLRPGAAASLEKLGHLIQRNPQAVFRVEGHTDSFGSDQYNLDLSRRRAETVKAWLVQNMNIDAGRVQAQGFGTAHLLVPADRSVEQQQLNRRVEIVIRTK
ncbi:MAG: OmpA family protein [Verrucomicrobia bacterium]|nr:OmpA family protein [Verrucomicrobiota bacterium]